MKLLFIGLLTAVMPLSPLFALKRPKPENKTHSVHRVQYGVASWYGGRDQGRLMACGEPFDEHEMIAAHRTLPLGSKVRVTNLRNGRSVVVRIKDRGPGVAGRVIDVSKAAARELHFVGRGLTPVKIRVLSVPRKRPSETLQATNDVR
ncbi:MAG: septal ring lytic transglycosylase RlpA family protein [Terriglobia bacterium]